MSRDVRKAYYGSLGVQVVEITPQVESSLNEPVLDVDKLQKLCLWVRIPHVYRVTVWKALLGVIPIIRELWHFAEQQRLEQYDVLKSAAKTLFPDYGADTDEDVMMTMFICQSFLKSPHTLRRVPVSLPSLRHIRSLAHSFYLVCDAKPADAFWLFSFFVRNINPDALSIAVSEDKGRQTMSIRPQILILERLLGQSPHGPAILAQLKACGVRLDALCSSWFLSYYADIMPPDCLERIWDVILGGQLNILAFIALAILLAARRTIEEAKTGEELLSGMEKQMSLIDMAAVTQAGIQSWEMSMGVGVEKSPQNSAGTGGSPAATPVTGAGVGSGRTVVTVE